MTQMADGRIPPKNRLEGALQSLAAVEPGLGRGLVRATEPPPPLNQLEESLRRLARVEPDAGAKLVEAISATDRA